MGHLGTFFKMYVLWPVDIFSKKKERDYLYCRKCNLWPLIQQASIYLERRVYVSERTRCIRIIPCGITEVLHILTLLVNHQKCLMFKIRKWDFSCNFPTSVKYLYGFYRKCITTLLFMVVCIWWWSKHISCRIVMWLLDSKALARSRRKKMRRAATQVATL